MKFSARSCLRILAAIELESSLENLMVSIISMNVNKIKLPATKGFTIVHAGYETWFTGATLIEIGVYKLVYC